MEINFEALTEKTIPTYSSLGKQSYVEHYLHLWQNSNPKPYIESSFTVDVVTTEFKDSNCQNFLVKYNGSNAGVLKVSINKSCNGFTAEEALYLHRIYLLKEFSGKGIGKATLKFVVKLAKEFQKKVIWLEAMKKGKAHQFYQSNGFKTIGETTVNLPNVLPWESAMWILAKTI
ncbi:GNAT family N-acetyltransferase [Croceivirga thetidis]|uniref:GNAT family N-acetyltransferase n=1 Tax=Croceivirga thetidis TaxID=2721623 RepID=A0ABX1GTM4_9FLAO|nr:GNAT family N-acetyltransferase [Croceivirga thetidis]NKI32974.1 GNAT family N-acetyltransferase [Croceivirga thetidis]